MLTRLFEGRGKGYKFIVENSEERDDFEDFGTAEFI
jgi:hypothetical protein